jgi:hypothetical protein
MFSEPYVVINQLIKSIGFMDPKPQQKMTKIGTFENMAQIRSFKSP